MLASTVPNRYIVQFSNPPVERHAERRAALRAEQVEARASIERAGGRVRRTFETLINAVAVEIPDAQAAQLAGIPGVKAVYPERLFHLCLDHALPLIHAPDAWTLVGLGNAGAGIKIGMIDTGIEITHPGFNDAGFTAPAGFPITSDMGELPYTNNKVIVARSYASLFATQDPDTSVRDHMGHGTATAMAAAGVSNTGILATISGVAPQAYIGVYKIFGSPGINDGATESAILAALEDAVTDGMNVINMSFGSDEPELPASDPEVQAVETASALGTMVVVAAGNNGPNPGTVGTPADAPHALTVGASNNDRMFGGTVQIAGGNPISSVPGVGLNSFSPISGPMVDVATIDPSDLACNALNGSLTGAIVLIERGSCTFETKLNNALAAGAAAAIIYDNNPTEAPILMGVGAATLPAAMVSNSDGLALRQQIAGAPMATVQFYAPAYVNPQNLASFSAAGPTLDYSIKPDLVAVGNNFYTAAETLDSAGDLYNPTGYIISQGTSFSAPLVAGAAAVVEAARPGLTVDQYRSLLTNSADVAYAAPGSPAQVQQAGGGFLNVLSALTATAAASPVSLSFGIGAGSVNATTQITVTNVGAASDVFQFSATARDAGAPVPQFSTTNAQLDPGASVTVPLAFSASGLPPGQYQGFIQVQGSAASVATQIPYWFAVPAGTPAFVTVVSDSTSGSAGEVLDGAVVFRVTDAAGVPLPAQPQASVVSGGGRVMGIGSLGARFPGDFGLSVRLGTQPGPNVFQIQAGDASVSVTITGQ